MPRTEWQAMTFGHNGWRGVLVTAFLTGATLIAATPPAHADGALAIDHPQGVRFGWSTYYGSKKSAERSAVEKCGPDCRPVLYFDEGCGAYATDRVPGSPVFGWAVRETKEKAQEKAVEECFLRGGRQCAVRVWACEDE